MNIFANKKNVSFNTYAVLPVFSFISATIYVNPVFYGFVFYDEYTKIKMFLTDSYDEKKYYSSSFFN